jgi:hypothetical protein
MVLLKECDECDSEPCWYKWRGQADVTGYIYWNGEHFAFGQINEDGVETNAVLTKITDGYLPMWPDVDPRITGQKIQGYWAPTGPDIPWVDAGNDDDTKNNKVQQVNPAGKKGFLVFDLEDACSGKITPQVKSLCEMAVPACETTPIPKQLAGCASDGDLAATGTAPALPNGSCALTPAAAAEAGDIAWMALGRGYYGGFASIRSEGAGASGDILETITYGTITTAIGGDPYPHIPSHYVLQIEATLIAEAAALGVRKNLDISVGGRKIATATAMVWDSAQGDAEDRCIATAVVPASANGDLSFVLTQSSATNSTYSFDLSVTGAFICPQTPES